MAQKPLRSITFPGLSDVYTVPEGGSDGNISSVNGQTGAVKTSWYFDVTGSVASPTTTQTVAQIVAAQKAGFAPICSATFSDFQGLPATLPALLISDMACVFGGIGSTGGDTFYLTVMIDGAGTLTAKTDDVAVKGDIPTSLKNPNALNIKIGNATTSYDGSTEKTVTIPEGGGGTDASLGITGAAAGEFPKVSAVNENGAPTAWEPVTGEEVTLGSGDEWVKVAEKTLTEIANEIRLNFDPCKAVYIEFQYGAVENDLGVIGIYPNPKTPVYISEHRSAASIQTTSASNKRGYIFCTIDCRKGAQWVATSQTFFRGDGAFGSIEPGAPMNCDISVLNNNTWASLLWKQQMANADHINSVSAFGAGMNIGTTLTVWGIKA